jgi:ABC-type branched-subunit amino acid transport system ATPase component
VQGAVAGAERIFGTLALPSDGPWPSITGDGAGVGHRSIVVDRVAFGYAEGQPVLHGVSFEIRRGERVALVGRTGAGKTSALHLVAGLYRPWRGNIRVAGHDPARIDESERRRVLGVVPQTVQLFSGTVMANLTLDDPSIPDAAVHEACRIAGPDLFIRALPQGYHTRLSGSGTVSGTHLSAGQQQLLALARAFVHRPVVLLFDEATAALDSASDAAFRAACAPRCSLRVRGADGRASVVHGPRGGPRHRARQGPHRRRRPTYRAHGPRRTLRGADGAGGRRVGLAHRAQPVMNVAATAEGPTGSHQPDAQRTPNPRRTTWRTRKSSSSVCMAPQRA